MTTERILILVRAMPEESKKYGHTVCVAGLTDNNEWRRLYPFEFRYGKISVPFKKKDLIEAEIAASDKDKRKESRKISSYRNLNLPQTESDISKRLETLHCHISDMEEHGDSICVIKPQLEGIEIAVNDTRLYDDQKYFSLITGSLETREKVKMPIEVRYLFRCGGECCAEKPHKIIAIDWEINELARNLLRRHSDKRAVERKMKDKLFDWMKSRNLYFIMGTHFKFRTPMIIGIFYPKK
ncbi:MAG: hypothetical protein HYY37_05055 [Candidatus Aenigmarchaeota archaeon]|nr:hypothetical protein [Candidatus Aenigmarchaeota archaeon]